jgi:succinyl-CoA synthetase alpha subunit
MIRKTIISKNRYFDSVFLMQIARRMASQPGIQDASALLATEANRAVLLGMGYGQEAEFAGAGPNDLVIALTGEPAAVAAIAADPETWLARRPAASAPGDPVREPRSIAEAVAARPECSVAVISVPGEHAAREARAAVAAGLNVFLFSSNVSVEDELSLKQDAQERGLIVMGPDCGTAYLNGAGIGFANAVRRGPVGIVGSSGTGMQEFSSLVHQAGSGISSGIGTGSRDLTDAIGGLSTLAGIAALEADPATQVITVITKPPGKAATVRLLERLRACRKPVVLCALGADPDRFAQAGPSRCASTIDQAVVLALEALGLARPDWLGGDLEAQRTLASGLVSGTAPAQRYIRGLFAGGTFCYQAQSIFRAGGLVVHSNAPIQGMLDLADPHGSREHSFVDMGAEVFVAGRPHPMIDASLRSRRLQREGEDPETALVFLDFILGAISSSDPVGDLLGAIRAAVRGARLRGGRLCVVASVCGTDGDAQGRRAQIDRLAAEGVQVFPSNAQAAAFCREFMIQLARRREERK